MWTFFLGPIWENSPRKSFLFSWDAFWKQLWVHLRLLYLPAPFLGASLFLYSWQWCLSGRCTPSIWEGPIRFECFLWSNWKWSHRMVSVWFGSFCFERGPFNWWSSAMFDRMLRLGDINSFCVLGERGNPKGAPALTTN